MGAAGRGWRRPFCLTSGVGASFTRRATLVFVSTKVSRCEHHGGQRGPNQLRPIIHGGGAVIFTAFLECFCGDSDSLRPADRRVSSFAFRNQRHSSSINRDSSFCFYSKFFLFWTTARKMTKQKKTVGPSDRSVSANEVLMDLRLCQIVGGKSRPFCWTRPDQKNPNGHPMKT